MDVSDKQKVLWIEIDGKRVYTKPSPTKIHKLA